MKSTKYKNRKVNNNKPINDKNKLINNQKSINWKNNGLSNKKTKPKNNNKPKNKNKPNKFSRNTATAYPCSKSKKNSPNSNK